jgi:hypothetical protein
MADVALVGAISQNSSSASLATIAVTRNSIVPGNLIVVIVTWDTTTTSANPSISDGTTTNSTPDGVLDTTALLSQKAAAYSFPNHAGGTKTFTATFAAACAWRGIYVIELQNAALSVPFEGFATAQGASSAAFSSGNVSPTPSLNGAYLIGFALVSNDVNGAGAPFTSLHDDAVVAAMVSGYAQAAAAVIDADFTQTPAGGWGAMILSFLPAAGPTTDPPYAGALDQDTLNDVDLNDQNVTGHAPLPADVGSFVLTGQAVAARADRRISAATGSFGLAGQAVSLRIARRVTTSVGLFSVAG